MYLRTIFIQIENFTTLDHNLKIILMSNTNQPAKIWKKFTNKSDRLPWALRFLVYLVDEIDHPYHHDRDEGVQWEFIIFSRLKKFCFIWIQNSTGIVVRGGVESANALMGLYPRSYTYYRASNNKVVDVDISEDQIQKWKKRSCDLLLEYKINLPPILTHLPLHLPEKHLNSHTPYIQENILDGEHQVITILRNPHRRKRIKHHKRRSNVYLPDCLINLILEYYKFDDHTFLVNTLYANHK